MTVLDPSLIAPARPKRALVAALLGNAMEYFDFVVYGFLAVLLGQLFFPGSNAAVSLVASLATFGVAFFFRPLGAAFFGSLGDRRGRKIALTISIVVMSGSTTLMALLPTYEQIGFLAPLLLVVLRCLQGFSVGGEFAGAATLIIENAPNERRGLWSSWLSVSSAVGTIAGSLLVLALGVLLSPEDFATWGWRIPFLMALPFGAVGLYMRLRVPETPVFQELVERKEQSRTPLRQILRTQPKVIFIAFSMAAITGLTFYYFTTYFVNHLTQTVGLEPTQARLISCVALAVYSPLCPLMGLLSDKYGRRGVIIAAVVGVIVGAVPVFLLLNSGELGLALLGLVLFGALVATLSVVSTVSQAELFPAELRMTGVALGNNLGVGLVAGSGPLVAASLVAATGAAIAPAFYLIGIAVLAGVVIVLLLPETNKRKFMS